MNPKVDWYFEKNKAWQKEIEKIRLLVLEACLSEELKWGVPCYNLENKNIVLIHIFKEYCALLFFKGALIKDPEKILVQQTENVQAARQMRFKNLKEIAALEYKIKSFILEAIEIEKAGLKVPLKKTVEYEIPEEFQIILAEIPGLEKAFAALTPGRQRGYLLFFSAPKQSKTRFTRIENAVESIFNGKGIND